MSRIKILFFIFTVTWLILVIRLFYYQIGEFKKLFLINQTQYKSLQEIKAPRGTIFSSDNQPLALSKGSYTVYIQPSLIDNQNEVYQKINQIIPLEEKDFLEKTKQKEKRWIPLFKKVNYEQKEKLEQANIKGISFEQSWTRFYPEASMSAHLLGFVGYDHSGKEKGYFGIEGFYDRELRGIDGWRAKEVDLLGRPILVGNEKEKEAKPGRNLYLYLNRGIQFLVEKELQKGIEKYEAVSGSVIVMDPFTGGILAMASFPSFDPAFYYKEDPKNFLNPLIGLNFEPGSVFKPIVMAMAIDLGLINPTTVCDLCSGPITIQDHQIKTWNDQYYPKSTMIEVIQHSDNVGMVFVSRKLGIKNFLNYLEKLGFMEKTGIDLEGESPPLVKEKKEWKEIDLATASFGQGIAITPIQLVRAISTIANGGILKTPRVVKKIEENGKEILLANNEEKRVLKEITTKIIMEMMVNAVEKGEAKWAKPKGYKIAGKTGTAQIPISGHYDPEKTIASFVGFAPSNNPKFVMLVILREPKTSPWGSETAAPLWFEIAKGIFKILNISPF